MSLPWYVTGASRPDYAKYKGSAKADKARAQSVQPRNAPVLDDILRRAQQPAWTPAPAAPAWTPAVQSWAPAPAAAPAPVQWSPAPAAMVQPQWSPAPQQVPQFVQPQPAQPVQRGRTDGGPPDPLAFLGGSEQFWDRVLNNQYSPAQIPGAIWDWGAGVGIDFSTPGTDATGRDKARDQAARQKAANELVAGIARDKQEQTESETKNRKEKVTALTAEEYEAMSPQQQAAVQFNTDLVDAVRRDRKNQDLYGALSDLEKEAYRNSLERLFGETTFPTVKGIEYAPETVGVLENLDLKPFQQTGKGLDDYLKLDVAITANQIKNLDQALTPTRVAAQEWEYTPREERLKLAQTLTSAQQTLNTEAIQQQVQVGDELLGRFTRDLANEAATEFGAKPRKGGSEDLTTEEAGLVDSYLQGLADPTRDLDETVSMIQGDLTDMGVPALEQERVWRAIGDVLKRSARGELDWFSTQRGEGLEVRDPQMIAPAIGMVTTGGR